MTGQILSKFFEVRDDVKKEQFRLKVGISRKALWQYEKGHKEIPYNVGEQMATIMRKDYNYLIKS